jgi:hypothetical protein
MYNILIVRTLVYTFFQTYKNIPKQLILIDFRNLTTNLKIGKTSVRVMSFIHSGLFMHCGFLFIDTKRLFISPPVKIRIYLIVF